MMRPRTLLALAIVLLTCPVAIRAQTTSPATTQSTISADLAPLFELELGKLYAAANAPRYQQAHELIERYFSTPSLKDRSAISHQLQDIKLDAAVVGRLVRVRASWQNVAPGTYFINQPFGPFEVKYFLGVPRSYKRDVATPLVIVLPTADEFVTNPPPDNKGVIEIYRKWMAEELERQRDAIVLMPLLNLDELYGPGRIGMNNVIQPMLQVTDVVNIDPKRTYLMGHSMGGHAVWNLGLHYPTYFASIAPLAGAANADWQRLRLMGLSNVYPVIWHDADDQIVPVEPTRAIVRALRGMKFDLSYIETKKLGHNPPTQVLGQVVETMRARTRELYPKEVLIQTNKPDTAFNRSDWVQIYQPIRPGKEQLLRLQHGTGPMTVNQNTCNVRASIAGNKVTIQSDNVLLLRLYFNDQMIDFKMAVTITVNGKTRFEGFLEPNIDEMLKDQVFLGRGWRYYTAVVDLDLGTPTTRPTTKPAS